VYGIDLVEQQLRIAGGERLALHQSLLAPDGHAVEARLYAEDPSRGFLPAIGTIRVYDEPDGPGVRVDSGVRAGTEVGTSYDPMLAKVIAHGPDRTTALERLDRALASFALVGVSTNAAFTRALIRRDDVRAGEQDTGLLERVLAELDTTAPADLVPAAMLVAAGTADPPGPWRRSLAEHGEARVGDGRVTVGALGWDAAIRFERADGRARVMLDGIERRYSFAVDDGVVWIARDGHQLELRTAVSDRAAGHDGARSLTAPMPGTVLLVAVADGDLVAEGDVLLVLESMKMELSITAPHQGAVSGLTLAAGDRVALGQPLVAVLQPAEEA
jgi:acetyl-CoA/propionyl-CoA carboxylase biotin carboxyl carrier protein